MLGVGVQSGVLSVRGAGDGGAEEASALAETLARMACSVDPAEGAGATLLLRLVVELPGWPANRGLEVLVGGEIVSCGATAPGAHPVQIALPASRGAVQAVLDSLGPLDRLSLVQSCRSRARVPNPHGTDSELVRDALADLLRGHAHASLTQMLGADGAGASSLPPGSPAVPSVTAARPAVDLPGPPPRKRFLGSVGGAPLWDSRRQTGSLNQQPTVSNESPSGDDSPSPRSLPTGEPHRARVSEEDRRAIAAGFKLEDGRADLAGYWLHLRREKALEAGFKTAAGEPDLAAFNRSRRRRAAQASGSESAKAKPASAASRRGERERRARSAGFVNVDGSVDMTSANRLEVMKRARAAGFVTANGVPDVAAYWRDIGERSALNANFKTKDDKPDLPAYRRYLIGRAALAAGFKNADGSGDSNAYRRDSDERAARKAGFVTPDGRGDITAHRRDLRERKRRHAASSPAGRPSEDAVARTATGEQGGDDIPE